MPLYLTISRGPRADRANPILASSDPAVIDAVLAAIARLDDPADPVGRQHRPAAPRSVPSHGRCPMPAETAPVREKQRRPLPLAARRAAWERVWGRLLAPPPDFTTGRSKPRTGPPHGHRRVDARRPGAGHHPLRRTTTFPKDITMIAYYDREGRR